MASHVTVSHRLHSKPAEHIPTVSGAHPHAVLTTTQPMGSAIMSEVSVHEYKEMQLVIVSGIH